MNRRQLLKGMTGLVLAERLTELRSAWAAGHKLPPPGLHQMTGDVRINGRAARPGMAIGFGDTITTGAASQAIYIVGQDAYLQRDRSTVSMTGDALLRGLRILNGKLLSVFGQGNKRIDTATATIGIRGTGCYIEAETGKVYFCLCYGEAEITSLNNPQDTETIRTQHHDHPLYLYPHTPKMMAPATVVNHTDAELILLESLVGRVPPFYGRDYDKSY